jgi:hypothetical protein
VRELYDLLRSIAREAWPFAPFTVPYRYRVVSLAVDRVSLQIVRKTAGVPDAPVVPMHPGVAGAWAALTLGTVVLVSFIEGDPSLPTITHFTPKGSTPGTWLPVRLTLDATDEVRVGETATTVTIGESGSPGVARLGDAVESELALLYAGPGTLTAVARGTPGAIPIDGTITSASSKVKAE